MRLVDFECLCCALSPWLHWWWHGKVVMEHTSLTSFSSSLYFGWAGNTPIISAVPSDAIKKTYNVHHKRPIKLQIWIVITFVSESKLGCKSYSRSKWRFSFSLSGHIGLLVLAHIFLVSILNYQACHIFLKYGCVIKKTDHIRPTYLTECQNLVILFYPSP